jgi:predicted aspartyl protease
MTRTLFAVSAATALACCASSAFAGSCTLNKVASFPARVDAENQLLVPAVIDGTTIPMVFDTGARGFAITRSAVNRLGLPITDLRHEKHFLGGGYLSESTQIGHFTIGGLQRSGVEMNTIEAGILPEGGDGSDGRGAGVIGGGPGALSTDERFLDTEIDPAAGVINLFDPGHCPGQVVYWAGEYNSLPMLLEPGTRKLRVDIELDGKKLLAWIDTGAAQTSMPVDHAELNFGVNANSPGAAPGKSVLVDDQPMPASSYSFHTLKIGDIVVNNPNVMLVQFYPDTLTATGRHFRAGKVQLPDLVIGMNILKSLHLYLAYNEGVMYYTPASLPAAKS